MTIDEVNAQFDDLQTAVTKEQGDIGTYIQGLKDQIAAGNAVTPAQLDALGAKIKGLTDGVAAFDIMTTATPAVSVPIPPAARPKR